MRLSDEEIRALWSDPEFKGAYSAPSEFRRHLKQEKGKNVSLLRLSKIFKDTPEYTQHSALRSKFPRRPYVVNSYGEIIQVVKFI